MNKSYKQSPNLLISEKQDNSFVEKYHSKISNIAKIAILLVEGLFILLLVTNLIIEGDNSSLEEQLLSQQLQLEKEREYELLINDTVNRINAYKKVKAERVTIQTKVDTFFVSIPNHIKLTGVTIDPAKANARLEATSPLDFSQLINNFFVNGLARQVILNSADYRKNEGIYELDLTVEYR